MIQVDPPEFTTENDGHPGAWMVPVPGSAAALDALPVRACRRCGLPYQTTHPRLCPSCRRLRCQYRASGDPAIRVCVTHDPDLGLYGDERCADGPPAKGNEPE